MPTLSFNDQERVRRHLGYTSDAVPWGDEVVLSHALAKDSRSSQWLLNAIALLDRCDRTFAKTEMDAQDSGVAYRRVLVGDRNYSDVEYRAESRKQRQKAYVEETNQLGRYLGARNYSDPDNWQYLSYGSVRQ